ncbi:MAG: exodeoxyribonuclease VII small subunit [Desulfosalsimonas sp.]
MAKKSFEESMNQLEKIVEELEAGNLPLDKALKRFEEGVKLSQSCFEKLDETEKKITRLMQQQQDGSAREIPFMADSDATDQNSSENE